MESDVNLALQSNRAIANDCILRATSRLCFAILAIIFFSFTSGYAFQFSGSDAATSRSVLARLAAATGWNKATIPADAVATGTVVRYFSDSSPSTAFTVKIRGDEQYRYTEDEAHAVLVTNGSAGAMIAGDDKARRIPAHSALSSRGMILPMATVLADWNSANVNITLLEPRSINGEACVGVQLIRRYPDDDPLVKVRRIVAPIIAWISTSRNIVLRADYSRAAAGNVNSSMPETVFYSDYRNVDGISVPFHQEVWLNDQHIKTLQFSSVRFNTGLTEADFDVAAIMRGVR